MEAQGLVGDQRHPAQFPLCDGGVLIDVLKIRAAAYQVEQIHHRFERIIDLVRNGRGKPSHGGELFVANQRCLSVLQVGDVFTKADQTAPKRWVPGAELGTLAGELTTLAVQRAVSRGLS